MNALYHLVSQQDDGLEGESPAAIVEEVFEGGPEEVHYKHAVLLFPYKVMKIRNIC